MGIVLLIVFALAVLLGLIGAIMSIKNWHWSQMLLLLGIVFATVGFWFLAAETVRIHGKLRAQIPNNEKQLDNALKEKDRLLNGTDDSEGLLDLEHELRLVTRQRGRVWRGVTPAGQLADGRVPVNIPQPRPHGIDQGATVFAFEAGEPNAQDPSAGAQYLGEFLVVDTSAEGAVLESVQLLDNRTGDRLANSRGPWELYESMPSDSHGLFTDDQGNPLPEEELRRMLPAESVPEYARHGQRASRENEEQWVLDGWDENDQIVGPEEFDRAVRFTYSRPLRDYAFLFSQLAEDRVVATAKKDALLEDIAKLETSLASAERLGEFRKQQLSTYGEDLTGTQREVKAIQDHLALVERQLAEANRRIGRLLASNAAQADRYIREQLALAEQIDAVAPAP